MAQLYYRYASMNAGKSIEIIKIAHNYEEQGKRVLLFTSGLDDRYGTGYVASRIGLKRKAHTFNNSTSIIDVVREENGQDRQKVYCILVDEGQFLTRRQVEELTKVVDDMNIPVIVYGLKNDFQNNLFEGSQALLIYADKIEEIKTICWFCNKKATMVLRVVDGKPVYEGEQILIGGNDSYIPVCRRCYSNPDFEGMKEPINGEDE
ncbi:MAG: thymidine kinase [Eubacteriaceae bacterium]|nr:thymidine kinase [Eubacteriaceae bacterium]